MVTIRNWGGMDAELDRDARGLDRELEWTGCATGSGCWWTE